MTPDDPIALAKTFDPAAIEARWYAHWETNGLFRPDRPDAVPFTIVNPPPNVTGSLHIGHALDNTLQDVVVRYERLRGKDALWVVGTDHAGIATQMVVERELEKSQDKRTNYSREDFIAKVWEWKRESGGVITGQLRRLGCSMDWSREQFTMDPHFTKAVTKVFVDLYNEGLIYRDKRLVNWDPKLKTAISDLEVETREVQGGFWRFRYPLADGSGAVEVATTRPETMLADMAVAVHPTDERYASIVGKNILQPLTGRLFPVVADEHADPELGSGVVKITPGHDFNDFEVGKRAGLKAGEMLNMFDAEAKVVQTADGLVPEEFLGLNRFVARELVVRRMKEQNFLVAHIVVSKDGDVAEHDFEPRTIATPFGDRGGVVIEPWLTDQWYVDAKTLAQPPIEAVRDGRIEIVPKSWEKTFFNWMENIQPWCVSRQLWWGHRIPAWYGVHQRACEPTSSDPGLVASMERPIFVAATAEEAIKLATDQYADVIGKTYTHVEAFDSEVSYVAATNANSKILAIVRDDDVLDTWFSSALWPFATLGWPDAANPLRHGEVPDAERLTEGSHLSANAAPDGEVGPLRPLEGAPPRAREDLQAQSLLARHYPNDLLISGFDILFFWDARMAMQGMHIMGEPPWKRLYLHGLVRAPDGQKMSKSKGNVVDPLLLIDQFGADALRFFMAAMESQGRDIKMDERRVEGYRNFATKLWNAARFCQSNGIAASTTLAAPAANSAINRWIIGEVVETVAALGQAMADLRFDAAANAIYHFVWDTFCDWYIELIKGSFDDETKAVAGWVLDQILVMLHPFMPFVTEELWHSTGARPYELIVAKWPEPGAAVDAEAKREVEWIIRFVTDVRSTKVALDAAPKAMSIFVSRAQHLQFSWLEGNILSIKRMTRASQVSVRTLLGLQDIEQKTAGTIFDLETFLSVEGEGEVQLVAEGIEGQLDFFGAVDMEAARARLAKARETSEKERDSLAKRLSNPAFAEKAKPEAVAKARADHDHHAAEAERLAAALARLG